MGFVGQDKGTIIKVQTFLHVNNNHRDFFALDVTKSYTLGIKVLFLQIGKLVCPLQKKKWI